MLNAMTYKLPHVQNHIADALSTSTSTTTYGPANICSHLDMEQQLLDADKKGSSDMALDASGKGNRSHEAHPGQTCSECGMTGHSSCCTTCKNWGHITKYCFGKGGAMEGKQEEVLSCRHAACDTKGTTATKPATKPAATGKPEGLCYDTAGHAYLLNSKTHEAIYIASAPNSTPPSESSPTTQKFTGLAYDILPSAYI
ncbi:hypothetical protein BDR04DRAFT_1119691 [Suillus decipiens]|nr:hypothetical protein BDR04DRAFT_1119691 [Suillus decipiens]